MKITLSEETTIREPNREELQSDEDDDDDDEPMWENICTREGQQATGMTSPENFGEWKTAGNRSRGAAT